MRRNGSLSENQLEGRSEQFSIRCGRKDIGVVPEEKQGANRIWDEIHDSSNTSCRADCELIQRRTPIPAVGSGSFTSKREVLYDLFVSKTARSGGHRQSAHQVLHPSPPLVTIQRKRFPGLLPPWASRDVWLVETTVEGLLEAKPVSATMRKLLRFQLMAPG